MANAARKLAYRFGVAAEFWAALYLILKGYRILKMRYRNRGGEIDILAQKGNSLVAVEVKARKSMQGCEVSITPSKQQALIRAMQYCLAGEGKITGLTDRENRNIRFDVIWVVPWRLPVHIKDAFQS